MPLFDVAPGNRIDPVDRNWMWMFPGQSSFPLTTFNRFVAGNMDFLFVSPSVNFL